MDAKSTADDDHNEKLSEKVKYKHVQQNIRKLKVSLT